MSNAWTIEIKKTLKLGVPMALSQLGIIAVNTTDVMFIGRLGPESLAAAALANSLWITFFLFSVGVLNAIPAMASQAVGAHKPRTVRRIARQGLWVAVSLGVPVSVLLTFSEPILLWFGQDPTNAALAQVYQSTLLFGMTPALLFIALRGYVSAYSIVKPVLIISLGIIPLNALLDYMLIFGNFGMPRLELWGAGLASAIVQSISFICLVIYVLKSEFFKRKAVLSRLWRADWPHYIETFKLGIPIGCLMVMEVGLFSAMALLMGRIGTLELAAHQVALQVASITFMVPLGLSQAVTIRVGYAVGKDDVLGMRKAAYTSFVLGSLTMACLAMPMFLWPEHIIGLFLSAEHAQSQAIVALGTSYLFIAALFQLSDGVQVIGGGVLRGMKDTTWPMIFGVIGYWGIGFSSGYYLAFEMNMDGVGIWLGLLTGLTAAAVLVVYRFLRLAYK